MRLKAQLLILAGVLIILYSCQPQQKENTNITTDSLVSPFPPGYTVWTMGPFQKIDSVNPILEPQSTTSFNCPVSNESVLWEQKDVFNPAAVVRGDQVYLLYRAEDTVGAHLGTSRIGLAISNDGINFERHPEPVFYPDNDFMKIYEWEGGVEDPRIVEDQSGIYYMTYTAFDGKLARLCVATSSDLYTWEKHGLAFRNAYDGKFNDVWTKSGSIVCRVYGNKMIAEKINGQYWMYWGDQDIYLATSANLTDWEPLLDQEGELLPIIKTREGKFDSHLIEPGPPAIITEAGIILIYNSRNILSTGDPNLPDGTYAAGQALFNPEDPTELLERTDHYFMYPNKDYEVTGQVNNVCFLEGLAVSPIGYWILYYGTADSKIAVASLKL